MNEMFILGLHGIYYTEQAVQDVRPLQVRCTSAEKSIECCPQDPGQAPGPTPAMRGPPPPPPSQPPAPARERATGQPGSSSAEPQPKKKEFREWRRSKEKGSLTRTWTRSPAPSRTPSRGSRRSRPSVWAQCCITSYSTPWWAKHTTRNSFPSSSLCSNRYTTMPSSYYSRLAARNHDWRVGAPVKEAGKRLCAAMARIKHTWTNGKSESKQNPAMQHRGEEHEGPCPQRHQGYLLHHEVSSEKVRNYQQLPHSHPHAYF